MKKFWTIIFLLPFLAGCTNDDTVLTERDKIEKYLTSTRHMVVEEEIGNVLADKPSFYSLFGRYVYRHIVNFYDEGREDRPIVEHGDKIDIRFNAFTFTGSEPSISQNLYWSNIPSIIEQVGKKSGNTLIWSSEPQTIIVGSTDILEGLERTLPGCREAESVQVYMTSSLAYGKKLISVIPKNSMIAWYLKIEKVTK